MEAALKKKQELVWTEEALFAKGVAHRVRNSLVSAQGQLFLTLERLGLLDPETKGESSIFSRFKLLMEGGKELKKNFQSLQRQFQEVTKTLDDYLHLTGLREVSHDPIDLKNLVDQKVAEIYTDRQPTLTIDVLVDDPLPSVPGDRELLGFMVRALIQNAMESLPNQTGRIVISLRNRTEKGLVRLAGPLDPTNRIFDIRDSPLSSYLLTPVVLFRLSK